MRHIAIVACPVVPYFSKLSHKRHEFRKKKLLNTEGLFRFVLQLSSQTFLIIKKNRVRYDHKRMLIFMYSSHCSSYILMKFEFS